MVKKTEKPWGYEELIYQGNGYAVKKIHLNNSCKTSLHYHEVKHETILMLNGKLKIELRYKTGENRIITLGSGEHVAIDPGVIHRMTSDGQDSVYFEAQTDHLSDVIRIEDDFGRN